MRREGLVAEFVVRVRVRMHWRGEVWVGDLGPWRWTFPPGQVVPARPRRGAA